MLLVLAGLVSVPKYLYEAAAIDRVSGWRQFWSITFPYIRGLMLLALLFRTIEAFKLFDLVFLLTNGGPGTATETIALRVYRIAFENNKTSESTALAYILLFTVIVLTNLYLYFANQRAKEAPRFMTDMTANAPAGSSSRRARAALTRRLRFGRSASGVGDAGWGRTLGAAIVSFIYFFPVFWIILTAFKTYEDALAVPAKFFFTPTLDNFAQVFSRAYSAGGHGAEHRVHALFLQFAVHLRRERAARARDRHLGRLRLLALSAQGQRHLSLHDPDDAHAACDRGHHPDLHHVPRHRSRRNLCRHHRALHGVQPAVRDLDDEELLRRTLARRRGRGAHRRLVRRPRLLQDLPAAGAGRASPRPPCSASF